MSEKTKNMPDPLISLVYRFLDSADSSEFYEIFDDRRVLADPLDHV